MGPDAARVGRGARAGGRGPGAVLITSVIFGPPGTGKTAHLLREVRRELDAGTPPERLAFLAFSRRAAIEARARAREELGLGDEDLRYWRTLHSTAARQLGAGGRLMDRDDWDALGRALGLKLTPPDEAGRTPSWAEERGQRVQYQWGLARARGVDLRASWAAGERDVPWLELERYDRELAAYKADLELLDYPDLIDQAPGHLPVDAVFLDEAQDLTPAQWAYVERLWADGPRRYVAGDDDQAIYDWAGADVRRFLALPGGRTTLAVSHRLPAPVAAVARRISARVAVRQAKSWRAADHAGEVRDADRVERVPVGEDGTWLLLARTRALVDRWARACVERGVPFVREGRPSVKPAEARAVRAWETARAGRPVAEEDAEAARELAAGRLPAPGSPPWREALVRVPVSRRRYYEACLRRDPRAITDPPGVTLSTVHGAKGGEADHVGLLPDLTPRVEAGLRRDPDAEHRVWYVATTRAKRTLWVVDPAGPLRYPLPLK